MIVIRTRYDKGTESAEWEKSVTFTGACANERLQIFSQSSSISNTYMYVRMIVNYCVMVYIYYIYSAMKRNFKK